MENVTLEDFIAETLQAISFGVERAREETKAANSPPIAPFAVDGNLTTEGRQLVTFHVVVEANKGTNSSVSGGAKGALITVVSGNLSGDRRSEKSDRSVQTIEFSVPIYFNAGWVKTKAEPNADP